MPRKSRTPSVAEVNAAPGGTLAVDRAMTLLGAFQNGDRSLTLSEFAQRTNMHKSTVLRLLASLEHAGLISRTAEGSYCLGVEIARLHRIFLGSFSLEETVMPVLEELVQRTGESASYYVEQMRGQTPLRMCLYRVDSPSTVRDHVKRGELVSGEKGTGARVFAAYREGAGSDAQHADEMLSQIRENGYSALVGDRTPELAGIAAPVFDARGRITAVLSLSMPSYRYKESYIPEVVHAAKTLSERV